MTQQEEKIDTADKTKIPLKRVLGLPTGILMVAGLMIGSGVFKKIAPMSATLMSEPYILSAWIIAGVFSMLGAFMLAGLATTTTESGGVYEYLRLSIGNFFSFLFGWTAFTIIKYIGSSTRADAIATGYFYWKFYFPLRQFRCKNSFSNCYLFTYLAQLPGHQKRGFIK